MGLGQTPSAEGKRSSSDNRRSNKPIMEKRRRARINNCLNDLKSLILDATKKDPARHSKLEKADILEKTVRYLQDLQRKQSTITAVTDPNVVNKYRAGFSDCAKEVERFPGVEPVIKRRLLLHLNTYLNGTVAQADSTDSAAHIQPALVATATATTTVGTASVPVHLLATHTPPGSPESVGSPPAHHHQQQQQQQQQQQHHHQHQQQQQHMMSHQQHQHQQQQPPMMKLMTNNAATNNGWFIYAQPHQAHQQHQHQQQHHQHQQHQQHQHQHQHQQQHLHPHQLQHPTQMPSLVPIPSRTASTASSTSSTANAASTISSLSSASSPVNMHPSVAASAAAANRQYVPLSPAASYEAMDYQTVHAVGHREDVDDIADDDDIIDDDDDIIDEDDDDDDEEDEEDDVEADGESYLRQPDARRRRLNGGGCSSVSSCTVSSSSSSSSSISSSSVNSTVNHSLSAQSTTTGSTLDEEDDQRSSCSTNSGPLSLVMKRSASAMEANEECPWRPW